MLFLPAFSGFQLDSNWTGFKLDGKKKKKKMDHGHKRRINSIMEKFTVQLVFPKRAIPKSHIEIYLAVVPVVAEATFKKCHSYVLNTILNSKGRAESPGWDLAQA